MRRHEQLDEETGISIDELPDYVGSTVNSFDAGAYSYLTVAYGVVLDETPTIVNREPHKHSEWRWFQLNAFPTALLASTASLIPAIEAYLCANELI